MAHNSLSLVLCQIPLIRSMCVEAAENSCMLYRTCYTLIELPLHAPVSIYHQFYIPVNYLCIHQCLPIPFQVLSFPLRCLPLLVQGKANPAQLRQTHSWLLVSVLGCSNFALDPNVYFSPSLSLPFLPVSAPKLNISDYPDIKPVIDTGGDNEGITAMSAAITFTIPAVINMNGPVDKWVSYIIIMEMFWEECVYSIEFAHGILLLLY